MKLVDTHAHIHSADYGLNPTVALTDAKEQGVERVLCVGTDLADSQLALSFAGQHPECYATIGLHPHDSKLGEAELAGLEALVKRPKVVAVGECGLDYYYQNSPKDEQARALRRQLEIGLAADLPFVFHVREAFEDFFNIIDQFKEVRGVVHSFTAEPATLEAVLSRGLYIGLNGIMTFAKNAQQLAAAKAVPADKLLLETDAPYLTPTPMRGKINQPANVRVVAEFLAQLRGEDLNQLAEVTTANARRLFSI